MRQDVCGRNRSQDPGDDQDERRCAFARRDVGLARPIPKLDDLVDESYREHLKTVIDQKRDVKCALSAGLILRYLERISDHATCIGESVDYIVTGVEPSN